ncbi:MAG: hypothetical protein ACOYBY_00135 [Dermatophilaceae bacterium]
MKAIAKLFETMLTKDATPTWGSPGGSTLLNGPAVGPDHYWGWGP